MKKQIKNPNQIKRCVLLSLGILLLFTACKKEAVAATYPKQKEQDTSKPKTIEAKDNTYEPMRYMALHVKAADLGLHFPLEKATVYGMVMDWNLGNATATTVAFQTGDASMYLSTSSSVIGGGQHQAVSDAAKLWVAMAQQYLMEAEKTEATPLPETNGVTFYFVTNQGLYTAHDQLVNIKDHSSYWQPLFTQANVVLTEIRKVAQQH